MDRIAHLSILMPTYNGGVVLHDTLANVLKQSFDDYEFIINDDCSTDNTEEIVGSFTDPRIKFATNQRNLGYPGNLEACRQRATGEFLFLMGQDDILCRDAISKTMKAFELADDIGAVTRPFFWFDKAIGTPVRKTVEINPMEDEVVRITDNCDRIITTINTLGQLSGLALRTAYVDLPFHKDVFPCHVYPFASIMKRHPVVFLKDFTVAVRIGTSQCRHVSSIYDKSPVLSWIEMYQTVFNEPQFASLREELISEQAAVNYLGLIQVRNYSTYGNLLKEIGVLMKYRPRNLLNPMFWFFSLGCMIMPPAMLIPMVDYYKNHVHSRSLKHIKFDYDL